MRIDIYLLADPTRPRVEQVTEPPPEDEELEHAVRKIQSVYKKKRS
jgi:hypothetical protein